MLSSMFFCANLDHSKRVPSSVPLTTCTESRYLPVTTRLSYLASVLADRNGVTHLDVNDVPHGRELLHITASAATTIYEWLKLWPAGQVIALALLAKVVPTGNPVARRIGQRTQRVLGGLRVPITLLTA